MELTLKGHPSVYSGGTITVELPQYMVMLPQDELDEATSCPQRIMLAIAAGRHPSGKIVFMTGDGYLREVNTSEHGIPDGPVSIVDDGNTLNIALSEDPVALEKSYQIDVGWAIKHGTVLLGVSLDGARVQYVD